MYVVFSCCGLCVATLLSFLRLNGILNVVFYYRKFLIEIIIVIIVTTIIYRLHDNLLQVWQ